MFSTLHYFSPTGLKREIIHTKQNVDEFNKFVIKYRSQKRKWEHYKAYKKANKASAEYSAGLDKSSKLINLNVTVTDLNDNSPVKARAPTSQPSSPVRQASSPKVTDKVGLALNITETAPGSPGSPVPV